MEVSQGTAPSGVSSGVAIQLLQEQDDTKLAPSIMKYSRWKQKYLSYLLKLVKYHYTEERTVKLVGEGNRMEAVDFRGADLTSTDIRFEDQSLTQLSNAARKQYIVELIGMGVLNPQMDKDLIIRMLELGITDELYDAAEVDVQQALNENSAWAKRDFSPITREYFNHEVHIGQHNKFRKSEEYFSLTPEEQLFIDAHVREHETYMMMAMQQQAPMPEEEDPSVGVDVNKVLGALSPEEREAVERNPEILNSLT